MKSRLVRIGNSRGVRLPKLLIEQAGLDEEVELVVREGEIVIARPATARNGWSDAAAALATVGRDSEFDEAQPTDFDRGEWHW